MRFLKRSARSTPGVRILRSRDGPIILCGRPGDRYFDRVSAAGVSESALRFVLRRGVRPGGVALDVGANIGLTTVMIARGHAGPVHAFEPHPETFAFLERTVRANALSDVVLVNRALGRAPGTLPFFVDRDSSASHVVAPHSPGRSGSIDVPVATVDDLAATLGGPVRFIKLDAEGAEPDIIEGAARTIARDRPAVFVEFNLFTLMALGNVNPRTVLERLRDTFRHVYRFAERRPFPIETDSDIVNFLHDALTRRAIASDLLCTFDPL